MTIEAKLTSMLVNYGLFPDMAGRVMENVKADEANEAMKNRWGDQVEDYPPAILALGWMSASRHALALIDKECPQHWARPIFANKTPGLV